MKTLLKLKGMGVPITIGVWLLAILFNACSPKAAKSSVEEKELVEFYFAINAEPEALDPHKFAGVIAAKIYDNTFEGLFIPDPETGGPINGLAESYSMNEDGTVYTFVLRDKLIWSDGKPITADDFVFSMRRILDPEIASPYAWLPAMFLKNGEAYNKGEVSAELLGVKKIDDRTVQLELVGPLPYVLDVLTHFAFAILPQHTIEKYGEDWTLPENMVSNGAFVIKSWVPKDRVIAEKNPNFWDKDSVEIDRVHFITGDDFNTNLNAYLNGELDMAEPPVPRLEEVKLRDDYYITPINSIYYYSLQYNKPELSDVRVRKALARSIDKKTLVEDVLKGGQIPTDGFVPPLSGYTPVTGYSYDVAAAQALLAEAGFPGGEGFPELTILYNTQEGHKITAEYIQQEWLNNLGIKVSIQNMEWKTFLKERRLGKFQVARNGWTGDYQDPNTFLDLYVSGGAQNNIQYVNPAFDDLIKTASITRDAKKRMQILQQAESMLIEEETVLIPIYYYTVSNMFNNTKWTGFANNVVNRHPLKFIKPINR